MATIKQVAEQAGVSVATVSRVANGSGYVSAAVRERVEAAMRALNYQPSALARGLRRQQTRTIGLLLPQMNQPFFSTLACAVERTLFAADYRTLICSSEENAAKEAAYIDILLGERVNGVILVPQGQDPEGVNRLLQANIPVVLVDRDLPDLPLSRVLSDNFGGAYAGTFHLLTLGHERIATISAPADNRTAQARVAGVRQALQDFGTAANPDLLLGGSLSEFEVGYQAGLHLLECPEPPSAVFALTDVVAVGVLHAAAQLGLALPADLSVIGFDDVPLATYVIPALTTIAQPIYALGQTAVEILLRRLRQPDAPPETVTLPTRLVIRSSTAPPGQIRSPHLT